MLKKHGHCPNLAAMVRRSSGERGSAKITRLWYDGCEIASQDAFKVGEHVQVEIRGMGCIRARVSSCKDGIVSVRFDEECPV